MPHEHGDPSLKEEEHDRGECQVLCHHQHPVLLQACSGMCGEDAKLSIFMIVNNGTNYRSGRSGSITQKIYPKLSWLHLTTSLLSIVGIFVPLFY